MTNTLIAEQKPEVETTQILYSDVKVFKVTDYECIAARSKEEAREWYMDNHAIKEEYVYTLDEIAEIPLDSEIYKDETYTEKFTYMDALNKYWKGETMLISCTF